MDLLFANTMLGQQQHQHQRCQLCTGGAADDSSAQRAKKPQVTPRETANGSFRAKAAAAATANWLHLVGEQAATLATLQAFAAIRFERADPSRAVSG